MIIHNLQESVELSLELMEEKNKPSPRVEGEEESGKRVMRR